ncbi:MAG: superoxide dismutase family protein [Clostridiales bacterium]|nr:superoxide dismutase family protein [Clostridiales bacterium]
MEFLPEALGRPLARAFLRGDEGHPDLAGEVLFYPYGHGTLLVARAVGLPAGHFLGFHIHETGDCSAAGGDTPFLKAGGHFNPTGQQHPQHSGDLPTLLSSAAGTALLAVYTDRFSPAEVMGRSVIIHGMADDFRSQPAGDSGMRIACGVIQRP